MSSVPLKYLNQYVTTTLSVIGGIDASQTTGIVIQSPSGLETTKPGIALLSYASPLVIADAEWITYTSIDGSNELQGVTRGAEGGSGKVHINGVTIAFPISESHINNLNAMFDTTGLDVAQIATPANPSSSRNKLYFKSDGKLYKLSSAGVETAIEPSSSYTVLTDDTSVAITASSKKNVLTLGGNRTLTLTGESSGDMFLLDLIQDGTGTRTVTWFNKAVSPITMTIANPGVVTLGKDIPTTTPISFTTTGALPTGVTASTVYYWIRVNATTGNLATSVANAQAGTTITTSGSQSGVHTANIQIRWTGNTAPTLTTGKHRVDSIVIIIKDATNGVYQGYVAGQDL